MAGLLAKERIIAPPDYNRWRVPLASIAIHLCIGSVYAWSIYNPSLTRVHGVVTSAADDWSLSAVVWVFTVAIVFLGLAAAFRPHLSTACWGWRLWFGPTGPCEKPAPVRPLALTRLCRRGRARSSAPTRASISLRKTAGCWWRSSRTVR